MTSIVSGLASRLGFRRHREEPPTIVEEPSSIVIAGHSHISALGVPTKSADGANQHLPIQGETAFSGFTGDLPRGSAYWQGLISLGRSHTVGLVWMGNQHNSRFMIPPGPPFDFALSQRPDLPLDRSAQIVPERAVREAFKPSFEGLTWLLANMKKAGGPGVVVLGTPPPKGDNDAIRAALSREKAFVRAAERLGADLATVRLSTPVLRLKLWHLLQRMLAETADQSGARFCANPPEVTTDEGFLRPEMWATDATHANRAYGTAMFRALERQLA